MNHGCFSLSRFFQTAAWSMNAIILYHGVKAMNSRATKQEKPGSLNVMPVC